MKQSEQIATGMETKLTVLAKRHAGPPLLLLTIVYIAFLLAGSYGLKAAFLIPRDSQEKALAYIARYGWSIQLGSFFELASAIPLGIFMATTISRLRFLGVRAAGESIALFGGVGAMIMLMLSSLANWSLTRPGVAQADGAVQALRSISFAGGGPGFVVPLGLFVAGVSITAGLYKLIPRWLMGLGIAVAIASELATFTLLNFTAGYFIPAGRFISIIWMIGISLTLPATLPSAASKTELSTAA
jgi:hypothetical protein